MKRQIVLIASLVAGLLAAVLTRVYVAHKEAEVEDRKKALMARYGTIDVLHFKRDLPAGTIVSRSDFLGGHVPALGLRGQAIEVEDLMQIVGRKTLLPHKANEVVFWSDIEGGNLADKGLAGSVKSQMRAISINVSGSASVSGMVKPNDHVDVIGTFNFPDDDGKMKKGDPVTCTILQNVLVLATGRKTAKTPVRELGSHEGAGYSLVTIEVTPREAEMLAFAEQIRGRLVLTLRNGNDVSTEKELPNVDFTKIRSEIEELNQKRQREKLANGSR
ncbi:MAG: Flp pilus assembly protein CpaB [Kiritimatiellia bacterium]